MIKSSFRRCHVQLCALLPLYSSLGLFQQRVKVEVLKPALDRRQLCISVRIWGRKRHLVAFSYVQWLPLWNRRGVQNNQSYLTLFIWSLTLVMEVTKRMQRQCNMDSLYSLGIWLCFLWCWMQRDKWSQRSSTVEKVSHQCSDVLDFVALKSHLDQRSLNCRTVFYHRSRCQMAAHRASVVCRRYLWLQKRLPCCRMWQSHSGRYGNQRWRIWILI